MGTEIFVHEGADTVIELEPYPSDPLDALEAESGDEGGSGRRSCCRRSTSRGFT